MEVTTFRSIIRSYAEGVEKGSFDTDITSARERKFVALLLRTASNDYAATWQYGTAGLSASREDIIDRLVNGQWNANVSLFVQVASPSAYSAYEQALSRTVNILKGI